MQYFFQTEDRFYFVMPFVGGGEMNKILKKRKKFTEEEIKFYTAQIIIGLDHLH